MLTINKLEHSFGGLKAITQFNLAVKQGEVAGVIGPNGAGKTTLFNLITGLFKPTSGAILFKDINIAGRKSHEVARLGIARTFQNLRLFNELSVRDNIRAGQLYRHDRLLWRDRLFGNREFKQYQQDQLEKVMDLVGISHRADEKAGNLPYGLQRKLEIARALATEPDLLLLDEPAAGMNPQEVMGLAGLIAEAKKCYNLTVVLIEHQLRLVEELCDDVTVMNFGQIIARGKADEVQNDKLVIKAYLGEGEVG